MRAIKTQKGFTIVETLIVLAVTSAMFIATTILVSGQIQKYQFRESSINMEQRLTDVINDVRVGYFGIIEGGTASILAPGQCKPTGSATGSTSDPGMSDCVYTGKKVVISSGANPTITVSSIVSPEDVNNLVGEDPTPGFGPTKVIKKDDISSITTDLPSGLDYNKGDTFYILFDRFGTTSNPNSKGEGQSVSVYGLDGGKLAKLANGVTVCASNGARYVSYNLGVNGSPQVVTSYKKDFGC